MSRGTTLKRGASTLNGRAGAQVSVQKTDANLLHPGDLLPRN